MRRLLLWLLGTMLLLGGCQTAVPLPVLPPAPMSVPVTNGAGETIQTGEALWVLVSGVDDHGLLAEPNIYLLSEAKALAFTNEHIHSGIVAAVLEIRQDGLRRFYRVRAADGQTGWVSDYNIRRVAYLYDAQKSTITLYYAPNGTAHTDVPNISPVQLLDPTQPDWWLVRTADGTAEGWVPASNIKESPETEFLLNGGTLGANHEH